MSSVSLVGRSASCGDVHPSNLPASIVGSAWAGGTARRLPMPSLYQKVCCRRRRQRGTWTCAARGARAAGWAMLSMSCGMRELTKLLLKPRCRRRRVGGRPERARRRASTEQQQRLTWPFCWRCYALNYNLLLSHRRTRRRRTRTCAAAGARQTTPALSRVPTMRPMRRSPCATR